MEGIAIGSSSDCLKKARNLDIFTRCFSLFRFNFFVCNKMLTLCYIISLLPFTVGIFFFPFL